MVNMTISRRFPKDFAATLMTAACAECLINVSAMQPHSWESAHYGANMRGYGSGTKTRGSLARSRSGYCVVGYRRLDEWIAEHPCIGTVARSPLWPLLRTARLPEKDHLFFEMLEPTVFWALHVTMPLVGVTMRANTCERMAQALAACQSFDAVAALWALVLWELTHGNSAIALMCGQYIPPALALLSVPPQGRRVALPVLARIRQLTLDAIRCEGQALLLANYDLPTVGRSAAALALPMLMIEEQLLGPVTRVEVPETTRKWVEMHRAPVHLLNPRARPRLWQRGLSPMTHPDSPCHPLAAPNFHPRALARIKATLGRYA